MGPGFLPFPFRFMARARQVRCTRTFIGPNLRIRLRPGTHLLPSQLPLLLSPPHLLVGKSQPFNFAGTRQGGYINEPGPVRPLAARESRTPSCGTHEDVAIRALSPTPFPEPRSPPHSVAHVWRLRSHLCEPIKSLRGPHLLELLLDRS